MTQRDTVANKDFIHIYLPVEKAENLLDTKYQIFLHEAR